MVFMCGHIYIYTYYLSTNIQRVAATTEHTNIAEDLFSSKMNDIECERRLIWGGDYCIRCASFEGENWNDAHQVRKHVWSNYA